MLEVLTHTKRRDFQGCPRYFYHRHVEHLQRRGQSGGRRRGSIFGQALLDIRLHADALAKENGSSPLSWPHRDEWLQDVIDRSLTLSYDEIRDGGGLTADDFALLDIEQVKLSCVLPAYIGIYGIDQRREVEFYLPLRNPRTNATSRAFRLGGKIDGMVALGGNHALVIEDKFVGQIQKAMIDRVALDAQASEYADALISRGWTAEISYRHTLCPQSKPKKGKEAPKFTPSGAPSKAKGILAETLEDYEARLRADIAERPEHYFNEQRFSFPTEHMDDYRRGRWGTAQQILEARRKAKGVGAQEAYPMNSSRCWEYGGCPFIPLCTKLEDAQALYVVVPDNPELRGANTREEDEGVTSVYGTTT